MSARLVEGRTDAEDPLRGQLERLNALSREATERIRGLSRSAAPAPGESLGDTLRTLAEDIRMRYQLRTSCALPAAALPAVAAPRMRQVYLAVADTVRCFVEHCSVEAVDLYAEIENGRLELVVSAAGADITPGACVPDGQPLRLAACRTQLLGGSMRVSSAGRRLRATLHLPL